MTNENRNAIIPAEQTSLGLPADTSGLSAYAASDTSIVGDFLKLNGKTGEITYGIEDHELPADAELAVLIGQMRIGYIDWQDGAKEREAWLSINEAGRMKELRQSLGKLAPEQWPDRDPRGRPRDPFRESVQLPTLWLDERKPLMFVSSSDTQVKAVKRLVKQCLEQAQPDDVPIVTIDVSSYTHSQRTIGEVFFPIFGIVKWKAPAQVLQIMNGHAASDNGGSRLSHTTQRAPDKKSIKRR
jgi:hypothetical protein